MNEFLFIFHLILVIGLTLGALRLGKEALIVAIAVQAILANLFVIKQVQLFGLNTTSSDVFAIGSVVSLNLLQEYFTKQSAKKALWLCFFSLAAFALMAKIHLLYRPSSFDTSQAAFLTILSSAPRLLFASLASFFIVQQIDLRVFAFLREKLKTHPLLYRNLISLILSQVLDTFLFSFLGLYGLLDALFEVIMMSLILKLGLVFALSPLSLLAKKMMKQNDNLLEEKDA